jgi:ABC-type glycerol-3-phosphate transport system substrate-binding protein
MKMKKNKKSIIMKKMTGLFMVLLVAALLTACNVEVRNTAPSLVGVESEVTIDFGDAFDPFDGITATDTQDGDLTDSIEITGFQDAWLSNSAGGIYEYTIYVEDSGELTATATVTLTVVGSVEQTVSLLYVQSAQTYYIGSTDYDPLRGVQAVDTKDGDPIDLTDDIVVTGLPSLSRPGRYTFTLSVENDLGASSTKTVSLTVKNEVDFIPDALTSEDIEITLWHSNGSTIETALGKYATEFKELYPNVTVNIVKNGDNYDALRQNVVSAIKGGTLPNIVQGYPDHVAEYISNNVMLSLNPYIDSPTWGYDSTDETEKFEDIIWNYRNENSQYTNDGEYYSLPFNKSTEVMIYNADVVDALIDSGAINEMPTTWQGLFAVSNAFNAVSDSYIESYGTKLGATTAEIDLAKELFIPYSYDSEDNAFITLIRQWGGQYTSIDSERNGVYLYDSDEAMDMLTYFSNHRSELALPANWGQGYASDVFKKGQTFVTIGSTGGAYYNTPSTVDGEYLFNFEVAPIPYNADLPEEKAVIQQGTNMSLTTTGSDQQKLASWLFLKYLTSNEVQLDFALETGYSPVRSSVYTTPSYENFLAGFASDGTTELEGAMLMRSKAARAAAQQSDYVFYDQAFVGSSSIRTAVGVTFARVLAPTEDDTIENALAYAVSEAKRILGI